MKVPLQWLKSYVDVSLSPEELARKLTFAGLEVESLRFVGLPLPLVVVALQLSEMVRCFSSVILRTDRTK